MTFRSLLPVVFLLSRACLLSCESNEIPLEDCSDCDATKLKTEIHTYSQPAWKDHIPASTDTPKKPSLETQLHSTELVGTTNVVTHGIKIPDDAEPTTDLGIETVEHTTRGYTTQTVKPTTKGSTTKGVTTKGYTTKVIPSTKGYTTKILPTGSTSSQNKITTKSFESTQERLLTIEKKTLKTEKAATDSTDFEFHTGMISPLYTGTFEVGSSDGPTTAVATTDNDVTTRKVTTEAEIVTTDGEIVTTEPTVATTEAESVTTEADGVTTGETVATTEADPTEAAPKDFGYEVDNEVDDPIHANSEYCVDHDKCYNGGEAVCERNGGDFLYCICQHGFTGTYCEQVRSMVDLQEPRGQGGFWDWKLSKYVIGGLGALTVIGLIMLTCMVVKCVKSGKDDRRRMQAEYNAVGLETFIPPAPVVQTTLMGAANMDRGSSDVMDERSEEEFHLHDSDDELGSGPVHVHRLRHHYPDPEDDGLHHAPSHRPAPSPDHYKVPTPTQNREYMNMNGKQNGNTPYRNGGYGEDPKISPYMNGTANTYSHKLNDKNSDQYAHLNRSFSKNAQPHHYLNLP